MDTHGAEAAKIFLQGGLEHDSVIERYDTKECKLALDVSASWEHDLESRYKRSISFISVWPINVCPINSKDRKEIYMAVETLPGSLLSAEPPNRPDMVSGPQTARANLAESCNGGGRKHRRSISLPLQIEKPALGHLSQRLLHWLVRDLQS